MSDQSLSGKVGLDTTDFKTAIAEMNRSIRVIESGFRASAAALGDWGKSADGLEMRIKALTEQIELQQDKVSALRSEYQRVASEKGETSKAAQDLQIKLNKETETLEKMKLELGNSETALSEMGDEADNAGEDVQELGEKSDDAKGKLGGFSKVVSGLKAGLAVGVAAITGLAVAVAGVSAAITNLVLSSADAAGELVDLSAKTGISTTRLQELAFVGNQVGTSQEVMTSSLARMIRSMDDARQQTNDYGQALASAKDEEARQNVELGELATAFQTLGISVTDANGNLRNSDTVFSEVITALGSVGNETERDALAMQIFGRSAMELNPLIKAGADEIDNLTKKAHEVGAVMSEENVASLESFGDELAALQDGLKGTAGTLAAAFLPAFSGITDAAQGYLKELANIVSSADGDLGAMADGIGGLLGRIISDIATQGPELLQAGLGIVQGIVNAIVANLPALVQGAVQMITTLVQFLIQNLPMMMNAGVELILALVNGILPQLPMLIEAAIQMIVTLAQGIAEAIPQILPVIAEIIPQIILVIVENLPLLIEAAIQIIVALVDGLITALPTLISYAPEIITAIYNALVTALPMIGTAAGELIATLITGLIGMIPQLTTTAIELIDALMDGWASMGGAILEAGKNIVLGIWEGIKSKAEWLKNQFTGFISGIVSVVNIALDSHSPSRVFENIGKNMALGLGGGFSKSFRDISNGMQNSIGGLVGGLQFEGVASSSVSNVNLGGITINITGNGDPNKISRAVESGVKKALRARGAV
jgi:septal ring factor EnvC (AmiA/AmiB activator)